MCTIVAPGSGKLQHPLTLIMQVKSLTAFLALLGLNGTNASPLSRRSYNATTCEKTSVAILYVDCPKCPSGLDADAFL